MGQAVLKETGSCFPQIENQINEVREALQAFIKNTGKSQSCIANEMGLSTAIISQFLRGIYTGDNANLAVDVQRYLDNEKLRKAFIPLPSFCPDVGNTKKILFVTRYTHLNNELAIIYGDAGSGKTAALKHYAANNPGVIYVQALSSTRTTKTIMYRILKAINKPQTGTESMMVDIVSEYLQNSNRLVVIDEAQHLNINALEAVRSLNDNANISVVLAGNEFVYSRMHGRTQAHFSQLSSRVGMNRLIQNVYDQNDINMLFPHLDAECKTRLLNLANTPSGLRLVMKEYGLAASIANQKGETISIEHLKEAAAIQQIARF